MDESSVMSHHDFSKPVLKVWFRGMGVFDLPISQVETDVSWCLQLIRAEIALSEV